MGRFRRWLLIITGLSNVPFATLVADALGGSMMAWLVALSLGSAATLSVRGRVRLAWDDRPISWARRWLIEKPYYLHWCAALGSLPLGLLSLPLLAFDWFDLRSWAHLSYGAPFVLAIYAVMIRPHRVRIRELEVDIPNLPAAFDGYRVAQLSDTHVGSLTPPERLSAWVRKTNRLGVDLVALTGDYVTSGTRFHEVTARALGDLRARDGVIAVLGNHDNFGGCEPLASTLREVGIRLLMNDHTVIERDGAPLYVAGVDDVYTRRADVDKTFRGIPGGAAVLGLAHDPRLFPAMAEHGAGLVLSGHTHWGQVGVPGLHRDLNIARPFFRFWGGLFHDRTGGKLWVHPGMGTTGPPVRLGVAPEITVLVLRSRPAPS